MKQYKLSKDVSTKMRKLPSQQWAATQTIPALCLLLSGLPDLSPMSVTIECGMRMRVQVRDNEWKTAEMSSYSLFMGHYTSLETFELRCCFIFTNSFILNHMRLVIVLLNQV
jgi:hypothetical protein